MLEGEGATLEDAVHDLCTSYTAIFINSAEDGEAAFIVEHVKLKFLGPHKWDPFGLFRTYHVFEVPLPRNLTREERICYEAMSRDVIYVDEPWVAPIANLPPDWQPGAIAREDEDDGTGGPAPAN